VYTFSIFILCEFLFLYGPDIYLLQIQSVCFFNHINFVLQFWGTNSAKNVHHIPTCRSVVDEANKNM
jgi:hypothetical protein